MRELDWTGLAGLEPTAQRRSDCTALAGAVAELLQRSDWWLLAPHPD